MTLKNPGAQMQPTAHKEQHLQVRHDRTPMPEAFLFDGLTKLTARLV
jgi:hypothetical protein